MHRVRHDIGSLYRVSLAEHEGIGTAYEYYAKEVQLKRFLRIVGKPARILIAGLPERYGFSMDFLLLSQEIDADVLAVDDRGERIEEAQRIYGDLTSKCILKGGRARFQAVPDLTSLDIAGENGRSFDLALSCEVVQRLESGKDRYFSGLRRMSQNLAIFVPNGENDAHARHSGLRSLRLKDLSRHCIGDDGRVRIYASGHLDMPPFPPGISRSQEKRERAAQSNLEGLAMRILHGCCLLEPFWPGFVKARFAHIAYVMAGL